VPAKRKPRIELKADPEYWKAFAQLMARIEAALGDYSGPPVPVYVAGGAASHIYTGARFSHDIDAAIGRRLLLPRNLEVMYRDADDSLRTLYFDRQYNDTLGLMHQDAQRDSVPIDVPGVDPKRLQVRVLAPVDLAVSKVPRFADPDREDIAALARAGLLTAGDLRQRAKDALAGYIGRVSDLRISLDLACRLIEDARRPRQAKKR
jgi:hypothetical protein